MTKTGAAHFASKLAAIRYYADYGNDAEDVQNKLDSGEIHIGMPQVRDGERVELDRSEGRYFIVSE